MTKVLKQNCNRHTRIELWSKTSKISGISDALSLALHPQKYFRLVASTRTRDGAICSNYRKTVPYHRESPNTRKCVGLRSPSLIIASGNIYRLLLYHTKW